MKNTPKFQTETALGAVFVITVGLFAVGDHWPLGVPLLWAGFLALRVARQREARRRSAWLARGDLMLAAARTAAEGIAFIFLLASPLAAQTPGWLPDGYEALSPTEEAFIRESVRTPLPPGRIAKVRFGLTYTADSVTITPSNGYATVKLPLPESYPDLPDVYLEDAGLKVHPGNAPGDFYGIVSIDSPKPATGTLDATRRGISYSVFAAVWPLKQAGASRETFDAAGKDVLRTFSPLRLALAGATQ